jgi:Domain of unknown function (DUF4331)
MSAMRRMRAMARSTTRSIVFVGFAAAVALAGCGRDEPAVDDAIRDDAGTTDAPAAPAPPALGAQIDRMGRPAITTALIAVFSPPGAATTAQRDAYNQAADPAAWRTTALRTNVTIADEIEANLAVLDALDRGLAPPTQGCQSALMYAGPPGAGSYQQAADLFADDQLYVDTSRPTCEVYFALELELASAGSIPHLTCGGRRLDHDVIDATYSLLASGRFGLDATNGFRPNLRDGVAVHPDIREVFPFLGPPH